MAVPGPVWVVTGASRGLGLEFVKQILQDSSATVFAGVRNPSKSQQLQALVEEYAERLTVVELDISSEASIKSGVASISAILTNRVVDVLINNAGVMGGEAGMGGFPEVLGGDLTDTFNTNVVGSYLLTVALLPLLRKGKLKLVINESSLLGSLAAQAANAQNPQLPFGDKFISYRVSKAALNMVTTVVANALKAEGFTVISLHPGWVKTEMGNELEEYFGIEGMGADLTAPQSISSQLKLIKELSPAQNGKFLQWDGAEVPW